MAKLITMALCPNRSPGKAYVEGDASSASYFLAGAAVTGGTVTVEGCGTSSLQVSIAIYSLRNSWKSSSALFHHLTLLFTLLMQGDVKFAEVLEQMGATVSWTENSVTVTGPPLDPSKKNRLRAIDVNMNKMPDVAMTLAVVALFADGPTAIRDGKFYIYFRSFLSTRYVFPLTLSVHPSFFYSSATMFLIPRLFQACLRPFLNIHLIQSPNLLHYQWHLGELRRLNE